MLTIHCVKRGLVRRTIMEMTLSEDPISLPIEVSGYKLLVYVVPSANIANRMGETWVNFSESAQLCSGSGQLPYHVEGDLKEFLGIGRWNYSHSYNVKDAYRIQVLKSEGGKTYYYLDFISFPEQWREVPLKLIDPLGNKQTYFEPLIACAKAFNKKIICVKQPIQEAIEKKPHAVKVEVLA